MKTTHTRMTSVSMAALFGSLGLTGCKSESTNRTTAEEPMDQELAEQVKIAFGNSPSFEFPDVQVAFFNEKFNSVVSFEARIRSELRKPSRKAFPASQRWRIAS